MTTHPDLYDSAEWHQEDLPEGLPEATAVLPLGFYWQWACRNGLVQPEHAESQLVTDTANAPSAAIASLGSKLTPAMFTDTGNAFTLAYYPQYLEDLTDLTIDAFQDEDASMYELPDDWQVYEAVEVILDARFEDWQADPAAAFSPLMLEDDYEDDEAR